LLNPGGGNDGIVARIAAIGDLHIRTTVPDQLADELANVHRRADALVVAGDITNYGRLTEAEVAADLFRQVRVPIIAVFGNHDRRSVRKRAFRQTFERAGVRILDGEATTLDLGLRVGFAGVAGCGGGFWPEEGPDALHSRAIKALALRVRLETARLEHALARIDADFTMVVMHFAPTTSTLGNEPLVKYWMLGNAELGRVVDQHRVDLVLHGHAHSGNAVGRTLGGTPVRNVATSVNGGISVHELIPRFDRDLDITEWSSARVCV
jgi:Icc-related predicted phosphoesterase